jgi:hypothetical protein
MRVPAVSGGGIDMGLVVQCDGGCGATTDDLGTFTEFGIVRKAWYCDKCAKHVKKLYTARDSFHTGYARNLARDLLYELKVFRQRLPNGKIPDAPE